MFYLKRILWSVLALAAVFVAINWQYFGVQLNYYLHPPTVNDQNNGNGTPETMMAPDRIRIASLGIDAPIIYAETVDEDAFQRALQDGVVHYPGTAMPGENGNAYYFGHSSDFPTAPGDYKTVFALLPQIEIGAVIEVSNAAGQVYRYKVDGKRPVESTDLSVLAQDESKKQLSVQTSYPIGTALRRYVVTSSLIE
jgi:LPXTG-site transpeptidase (sortase) family protein